MTIKPNNQNEPTINVLLVDDEETTTLLTTLNLESPYLKVTAANKPSKALRLLTEQKFDCIVSDYQMPEMNGVQLCIEVRKTTPSPSSSIRVGGAEVASAAFAAGVDDYVKKEKELSHYQVLAKRITHAVERKRAEAEAEWLASFPQINPNPIFETDLTGKIDYANPAAMQGFSFPGRVGTIAPLILNWGEILAKLKNLGRKPLLMDIEIDGVWFALTIHSVPGLDRVRIYATNMDELKKGERALKESVEELASVNEELASTAEELRTSNEELSASNEELRSVGEELIVANEQEREQANRLESLVLERTRELHESEERQRGTSLYTWSLIEASLDPLVTISAEGKITDVNEATIQATGATREELVGSEFADYFTEPEKAREGRRRVFAEGHVRDYALTIRNKLGRLTDVLYNATLYRNQSGEVAGIFAAARDVTEKNRLLERLQRSEVIAAVEQMGATVAHDLRGPLGQVVQAVNMIKQDPSITPRMLQIVEENAVRSLKMIADWRSSTREIEPQPVVSDLHALVKHVLEGVNIPRNVEVVCSLGEGLTSIRLDPDIMHRVLDNLVKNAVEAMPKGGRLDITANKEANDLLIKIGDTGVGIPEEARKRIFSPLYTTKAGGMGLGLTYSRRAVETMGGSIDFKSDVGVGTIFTIKLPIQDIAH